MAAAGQAPIRGAVWLRAIANPESLDPSTGLQLRQRISDLIGRQVQMRRDLLVPKRAVPLKQFQDRPLHPDNSVKRTPRSC